VSSRFIAVEQFNALTEQSLDFCKDVAAVIFRANLVHKNNPIVFGSL
jgi:hypothetical protein